MPKAHLDAQLNDERSPACLVVELTDHDAVHFDRNAHGLLRIAAGLNRTTRYTMRATLLSGGRTLSANMAEVEGIWLSKGGHLLPTQEEGDRYTLIASPHRSHVEVLSAIRFSKPTAATSTYPIMMTTALNLSLAMISTARSCLTDVCPTKSSSIHDIYFRAGRPSGPRFWFSRRLSTSNLAAIVLSLGLSDFQHLLATNPSGREIDQHSDSFVQTYAEFITAVRLANKGYASTVVEEGASSLARDASYLYNSLPGTLPIFVLTPFTSSRHLRRLLGHVTAAAVRQLNAEGDFSTIWIDTESWIPKDEFETQTNGTGDPMFEQLTLSGHARAATYLSTHLCPYLGQVCPFARYDTFGGHLYIPAEEAMGKLLEERKVTLIKEFMSIS